MKDYKHIEHMRNLNDSLIWERMKHCYDYGYEDRKAEESESARAIVDTEQQKSYEDGLNDAWELVKRIESTPEDGGLTNEQIVEVFGQYWSSWKLYRVFSVGEALAKIKAYEDKRNKASEFKVGDEVRGIDSGKRAVILDKKYGLYRALSFDGIIHEGTEEAFTKTGRTFPQIAEVLADMRGTENDE